MEIDKILKTLTVIHDFMIVVEPDENLVGVLLPRPEPNNNLHALTVDLTQIEVQSDWSEVVGFIPCEKVISPL